MKLFKLTTLAIAGALTFAACKYEDGPTISFRAKRDRVANEWKVKSYTYDEQDALNKLVDPEFNFEILLNLYRTGAYGVQVVKAEKDQDGNVKYITNHKAYTDQNGNTGNGFDFCCWPEYKAYLNNLPSHIAYIMPSGEWTFDRGHTKIQVKPELSYDNQEVMTQKNTIDWKILMLREKELKVEGRDENDKKWVIVFERINDEPYFY